MTTSQPWIWLERLKQRIRLLEARLTPRSRLLRVAEREVRLTRSLWWDDTDATEYSREIEPYWMAMSGRTFAAVLDVGAATGLFTLSVCVRLPGANVYAFEPSPRQRMMLRRNVARNGFGHRVQIQPYALWNRECRMEFRTHGAIGALKATGEHIAKMPFAEEVQAMSLDCWAEREKIGRIDLIKMDVEGAEIEVLEGSRDLLERDRPVLLVQAYHLRGGQRTFGECSALLAEQGYCCVEAGLGSSGLLHAEHRSCGGRSRKPHGVHGGEA